jgi:penicillin amidase
MAHLFSKLAFRAVFGRRLPLTEGVVNTDGPEHPIRIDRDRFGVPHITAASDGDAWFGLGFCQGQDRSFQIETLVRVVRGTTSELIGKDTVGLDRLARRIGFKRAAAKTWNMLDEDGRRSLTAFAAGVNAGRANGTDAKAHEFSLLRADPTKFEATDVLAMMALQAFGLAANWDAELARFEILTRDGEDALDRVDPRYPEWHPVTESPDGIAGLPVEGLLADLELLREISGLGGASNNWALAGAKTATGRPILANDPHLGPVLPAHWYLAHVKAPDWAVAGACFAGTPGFTCAHNGRVAWGVTAGLVDNTDLFIEEIGPDGASVRRGETFVPCTVVEEHIAVRGADPVTEEVLVTPHGPIVGPALPGAHEAISMAATWLNPQRATSGLDVVAASTVADLRERLRGWNGPTLNFVAADVDGSIGWQLAGESPVRKKGRGALPLPAWADDVGWEAEYVPYDAMPHSHDPERGYVATANTRPSTADEPFLGVDWIEGYRLARINELLSGRDDWDIPATLQAQLDTVSHAWKDLRDHVLSVAHTSETSTARSLLAAWDGDLATDSRAGSVFILWLTDMQRRVAEAAAPHSTDAVLGRGFAPAPLNPYSLFAFSRTGHLARLLNERPDGWFDDWEDPIRRSLAAAERTLRERFGPDPARWEWGQVRPLTLLHPVGQRKPMDRIFNIGPIPWSGDFTTVSQAGAPPLEPLGNPSAIASLRMAVDVGDWDRSRFSIPGGQSGNPLSPHYGDQVDVWRLGLGVPMAWTDEAVARAAAQTLLVMPRAD